MTFCVCDPQRLSELYYDIHRSYLKVTEVVNSEKRLFGRYYRVAFYGLVSAIRATENLIERCVFAMFLAWVPVCLCYHTNSLLLIVMFGMTQS